MIVYAVRSTVKIKFFNTFRAQGFVLPILCITTIYYWILHMPPLQDPMVSPKLHVSNPLQAEDSRWDILHLYHAAAKIQTAPGSIGVNCCRSNEIDLTTTCLLDVRLALCPCQSDHRIIRLRGGIVKWPDLISSLVHAYMRVVHMRAWWCASPLHLSDRWCQQLTGKGTAMHAQGDNPVRLNWHSNSWPVKAYCS